MGGRPIVRCQRSRKNGGVSTMCFCAGVHGMVIQGAKERRAKSTKEGEHKYTGDEHRSSGNNKCTRLRTLPQRNTEEFAVVGGVPFFVRQAQQNRHGIRPRRQHKHNRGFTRGYVVTRP